MQSASISSAVNSLTTTAGKDVLPQSGTASAQTPFAGLLKDAIHSEQSLENQAAAVVEGLMTGQGVDVHQAMIETQKADLAFEMALAVRSKAVAAYQQMMQMQF